MVNNPKQHIHEHLNELLHMTLTKILITPFPYTKTELRVFF